MPIKGGIIVEKLCDLKAILSHDSEDGECCVPWVRLSISILKNALIVLRLLNGGRSSAAFVVTI